MDCAMQTHPGSSPKEPLVPARLAALRERMRERGLQAVVVRSTDAYLNEYVPEAESTRVWLTGFTGSMGDAVVTGDRALLFVDGRYTLQAAREAPDFESRTVPLGASIEQGWLGLFEELSKQGVKRIGVESDASAARSRASVAARPGPSTPRSAGARCASACPWPTRCSTTRSSTGFWWWRSMRSPG
jgi:Xaa-Pro aminopeptidase